MSFYCNCQSDKIPGPINGNPLNGLCEKVCVDLKKVFDACLQQGQQTGITVTLNNLTPANPTYPLTFVSARSSVRRGTISNLIIEPIQGEKTNQARVRCDVTIDTQVAYTDANGVAGAGTGVVTVPFDVVMCLPAPSVMPYGIEAVVSLVSPEGTYTGNNQFTINACVTVILKVVVEVELLIPTYGYCVIPQCQQYTQEVCSGIFDLPLYPQ